MNQASHELGNNIHVARDREPVRILGAWLENKIENEAVWSIVIDKIKSNLERWAQSHPTIFGRKDIVQMIVGRMSQYMAVVQGTTKKVEAELQKTI